jgi:hypothetical protein
MPPEPAYRSGVADSADELIAWERLRRDVGQRNALGALRTAAERRDADQERAVRLAADNLLDKAVRRLRADEDDAARALVDRALRLSLETSAPGEEGAVAVHLFVWDAVREAALGGQHADWLDRVAAVQLEGPARREWFAALRALAAEGEFDAADVRRIRGLSGGAAVDHEPFTGVDHDDRIDATLALLRALIALND